MLRAGEVFAGYVIKRRLGRGGMGAVYLAQHPRLPRLTALKLLDPELYADNEIRARFEREAALVARLDHPNIVQVYDRGFDEGLLWISMQYVDGVDAAGIDPRTVPPERAAEIIVETAKALDYAHAIGVLHRDVKPANILLARTTAGQGARVLLTDFGIARLRDESRQLTESGALAATLAYASPEQLSFTPVDHRSDQYSLACSLFWLLTGSSPFAAGSPAAIIAGHLQHAPPSVRSLRETLPSEVDAVLAKALAKQPDERFASCTEFAVAAQQALTASQISALPQVVSQEQDARAATKRSLRIGGLVLGVVIALVAGFLWVKADRATTKTAVRTGPIAQQPIDWSGAVAPGTTTGPAPFRALTQIDAEGKEVVRASTAASPAGDGKATCEPVTIASTAPLTGNNAGTARGLIGGVKLAVDQFTRANPDCRVSVREFDTGGFPQTAADVARQIVGDPSIVALVGPLSSEIRATGGFFSDAGLPFLFPGTTPVDPTSTAWRSFFRGVATDDVYRRAVAKYLLDTARFRKICVVRDDSGFGKGMAHDVIAILGAAADPGCRVEVKQGERDFAAVVGKVAAAAPDAVLYSGYSAEAAAFAQQLKQGGVTAAFVATEGALSVDFVAQARDSAQGAMLTCSCGPVAGKFYFDFRALNGQGAGWNAVEAYDLTTIALNGIAAGHRTRADLLTYLRGYQGTGLARTYDWSDNGQLTTPGIWIYTIS
ncbi:bifunctional serine/threonine-protein kinase/ABC transporter substrate-binding protein [Nocardia suismassiliense]|uniref:bifunctional serine/threonine-protein kinase/ABC transporter substrate-binding protein n=1 Tax=Nocardia suismassiliense TaxID=2077092 RepID=UPI002D76C3EF|nr:bifunctional serine/threonine-protein kinase/ABC transporter substrate-binding protein [Nocardia suismassiliense]